MLMVISFLLSMSVKAPLVNWAPWSVLKIPGALAIKAFSRAAKQKPVSIVIEVSQERTYRLNQSMIATR
jgi:hypothetical protein